MTASDLVQSFKQLGEFEIVIENDDRHLGTAQSLMVDPRRWRAHYLVLDCRDEHGGTRILRLSAFERFDWIDGRLIFCEDATPLSLSFHEGESELRPDPVGGAQGRGALLVADDEDDAHYDVGMLPESAVPVDEKDGERASLCDVRALLGAPVLGRDRAAGTTGDLLVSAPGENRTGKWYVRYFVVRLSRNHTAGTKHILLAPQWCENDWHAPQIRIDLLHGSFKSAPPYQPTASVTREYEDHLYEYFGRPKYWEVE